MACAQNIVYGLLSVRGAPYSAKKGGSNDIGEPKTYPTLSRQVMSGAQVALNLTEASAGRALSAGRDRQLRLWCLAEGRLLRCLAGHQDAVRRWGHPIGQVLPWAPDVFYGFQLACSMQKLNQLGLRIMQFTDCQPEQGSGFGLWLGPNGFQTDILRRIGCCDQCGGAWPWCPAIFQELRSIHVNLALFCRCPIVDPPTHPPSKRGDSHDNLINQLLWHRIACPCPPGSQANHQSEIPAANLCRLAN